jgi:hypothetical protein
LDKKVFALSPLSHFVEHVVSTCERGITTPHAVRSPPGRRASKAMQESKVPAHIYLICSAADALSWDAACIARPFLLRAHGSCWTETRGYLAALLVMAAARRPPARAGPLLSGSLDSSLHHMPMPELAGHAELACDSTSSAARPTSQAQLSHSLFPRMPAVVVVSSGPRWLRQPRRPNSPALSSSACPPPPQVSPARSKKPHIYFFFRRK